MAKTAACPHDHVDWSTDHCLDCAAPLTFNAELADASAKLWAIWDEVDVAIAHALHWVRWRLWFRYLILRYGRERAITMLEAAISASLKKALKDLAEVTAEVARSARECSEAMSRLSQAVNDVSTPEGRH
jgi:hypothetical protein